MTYSKKNLLLLLLVVVCAVALCLCACNEDVDPEEVVNDRGNTVQVILDNVKIASRDFRLKPNSPVPEPGVTKNAGDAPTVNGFIFVGYYEGTKAADGTITYGEKWDFSKKVSANMTLYAKWDIQYRVRINFVIDGNVTDVSTDVAVPANAAQLTSLKDPVWNNHTYVAMYSDSECNNPLTVDSNNPFVHGCTQSNPVADVYAKFIEGVWTLVYTAADMRTISPGTRLYLMNDIDCTGVDISISRNTFSGAIVGNGHTISNLNYVANGETNTSARAYNFGLFTQVTGVEIRDVTFANCSVGGVINRICNEYNYGFIAGSASESEDKTNTFSNITFVNCVMNELTFGERLGLDAEKQTAELLKVEKGNFIASGSDYQPNISES